eukprot:jgi/Mesvir1/19791/Mv13083-RA.1
MATHTKLSPTTRKAMDLEEKKRKRDKIREEDRALAFCAVRLALSIKSSDLCLSSRTIEVAMDAIECYPAILVRNYSVSMDLWTFYKALEVRGVDKGNQDFALLSMHARKVAGDYHAPCERHDHWTDFMGERIGTSIYTLGWRISPAVAIVCKGTTERIVRNLMNTIYERPEHLSSVGCIEYPEDLRPVTCPLPRDWTFDGIGEVVLHGAMVKKYEEESGWRVWDDSVGPSFAYGPRVREECPFKQEKEHRKADLQVFWGRVDSMQERSTPIECTCFVGGDEWYSDADEMPNLCTCGAPSPLCFPVEVAA